MNLVKSEHLDNQNTNLYRLSATFKLVINVLYLFNLSWNWNNALSELLHSENQECPERKLSNAHKVQQAVSWPCTGPCLPGSLPKIQRLMWLRCLTSVSSLWDIEVGTEHKTLHKCLLISTLARSLATLALYVRQCSGFMNQLTGNGLLRNCVSAGSLSVWRAINPNLVKHLPTWYVFVLYSVRILLKCNSVTAAKKIIIVISITTKTYIY